MKEISNRFGNRKQDLAGDTNPKPVCKPKPIKKPGVSLADMMNFKPVVTLPPVSLVPKKAPEEPKVDPVPPAAAEVVTEVQQTVKELQSKVTTLAERLKNNEPLLSTEFKRKVGLADAIAASAIVITPTEPKTLVAYPNLNEVKQTLAFDKPQHQQSTPEPGTAEKIVTDTEPSTSKKPPVPKKSASAKPKGKLAATSEGSKPKKAHEEKSAPAPQEKAHIPKPKKSKGNFVKLDMRKSYHPKASGKCRKPSKKQARFFAMKQQAQQPRIKYEGLGSYGLDGPVVDQRAKSSLVVFSEGYRKEADILANHIGIFWQRLITTPKIVLKDPKDEGELKQILRDCFGFTEFRHGQLEAIKLLLSGAVLFCA